MAGQALVTDDPFLAFLPPSKNDLDDLVVQALENLHRQFKAKQTPKMKGLANVKSKICGLFYSYRVKVQLQQQARKTAQSANMAVIYSFVERYVANLILDYQGKLQDKKECGLAILYVGKDGDIELTIDFEGDYEVGINEVVKSKISIPTRENIPVLTQTCNKQEPSRKKRKFAVAETKEEKVADAMKTETSETIAENITKAFSLYDYVSQNVSVTREELIKFIVTSALLLSTMYFFVFPFLKMLAAMLVVLLAVIMLFDPMLAIKLATVIFEVIMFLAGLMGRNIGSMIVTAAFIFLCIIFAKRHLATEPASSASAPVVLKSSSEDIRRRWALLCLRMRESSNSASPLNLPVAEPMIKIRLRDRAYSQ
mmetsp:Transcript_3189/g.4287  ORF Transcript_3189/g.4287 Transcript_3189/m.4287 type:complete len:369 (+) Transcript_3189:3-1109(+)